jgi:Leucine-rich repeat (LRR) protein
MGFMTNILDCSGYRLTMLPGMEGAMTSLTELKLSNNLLKRLPD